VESTKVLIIFIKCSSRTVRGTFLQKFWFIYFPTNILFESIRFSNNAIGSFFQWNYHRNLYKKDIKKM